MNRAELIRHLRGVVKAGGLACLGCKHGDNCGIHGCAIIRAAMKELEKTEWISIEDGKPNCEQEVFVKVKHKSYSDGKPYYVTTTAIYEDGKMSTEDSKWFWVDMEFDYDEEKDQYLIPEGWWEYRHYNPDDVYNNMIDGEVTHWMPLPELPEPAKEREKNA